MAKSLTEKMINSTKSSATKPHLASLLSSDEDDNDAVGIDSDRTKKKLRLMTRKYVRAKATISALHNVIALNKGTSFTSLFISCMHST